MAKVPDCMPGAVGADQGAGEGSRPEKLELCRAAAVRWGQGGPAGSALFPDLTAPAGVAGAGASKQWAQVAERRGRQKWQLPSLPLHSPHPTVGTVGRI